jgi:hypothetical protein
MAANMVVVVGVERGACWLIGRDVDVLVRSRGSALCFLYPLSRKAAQKQLGLHLAVHLADSMPQPPHAL